MEIAEQYAIGDEIKSINEMPPFGNESTEHIYAIHLEGGGYAYILHGTNGKVWVDTQKMRPVDRDNPPKTYRDQIKYKSGPGQGGDLIYQAAMTYALNNGLEFVPDRLGVSAIAQFRRTSQMLSSALRHGTTRHLGKTSIEGWRAEQSPADFEHNLNLLAIKEMEGVEWAMKRSGETRFEDLKWDAETDTVIHEPTGRRLSQGDIEHLISRLDPGNSGVGETTLSRAFVTRQALQGQIIDGADLHREGDALPDGGGKVSGDTGSALFRIRGSKKALFYSKPDGGGGPTLSSYLSNDAGKLSQEVAVTTQLLQKKQPGLVNESTHVFHNTDELLSSDYAKQHPFTEDEKAAMRNAEGFYDASTGKTVIIAGNVGLRPGETPQSALTRVGHDGLGLLLNAPGDRPGKPNINRQRWDNLQRSMPQHLLEAIGNQPGYEHLKGNQEALALEWFAREAEARPELLTKPSLVQAMWDNFKQGVVDLMVRLGLDPLKGQDLDTQVMALLQRARQAAVRR